MSHRAKRRRPSAVKLNQEALVHLKISPFSEYTGVGCRVGLSFSGSAASTGAHRPCTSIGSEQGPGRRLGHLRDNGVMPGDMRMRRACRPGRLVQS